MHRLRSFCLGFFLVGSPLWAAPSVYDFKLKIASGKELALSEFKDQVLLVVNTASHCGYTKQFSALEAVYKLYKAEGLVVLGVPSNSFKQEFKDDAEAANFCKLKFGVSFPMSKIVEVKGAAIDPLFAFLVAQAPKADAGDVAWNFEKFLVDRKGQVIGRYRSDVTPDDPKLSLQLKAALASKAKS